MDDQHDRSAAPPFPPPRPPRRSPTPPPTSPPPPPQMLPEEMKKEELLAHVATLEAAFIRCLPYGELRALENSELRKYSLDVYLNVHVEKFARDFMEAAKRLHLYFIELQKEDEPTKKQLLQEEIATMEEELKKKNDLIQKNNDLIQTHSELMLEWSQEVKEMLSVQSIYMTFV